jgi:flagellar hook-basal body complex protein FliE
MLPTTTPTPVTPAITLAAPAQPAATAPAGADQSFAGLVRETVERLDGNQREVEQEIARVVTGESTDLHRTMITLQTAELSFQLALQVRNKIVGAYEEIMRMQV